MSRHAVAVLPRVLRPWAFVAAGLTKFVVRPAAPVASWRGLVEQFVAELGPEQT